MVPVTVTLSPPTASESAVDVASALRMTLLPFAEVP